MAVTRAVTSKATNTEVALQNALHHSVRQTFDSLTRIFDRKEADSTRLLHLD